MSESNELRAFRWDDMSAGWTSGFRFPVAHLDHICVLLKRKKEENEERKRENE
jgi:hypothetical protein